MLANLALEEGDERLPQIVDSIRLDPEMFIANCLTEFSRVWAYNPKMASGPFTECCGSDEFVIGGLSPAKLLITRGSSTPKRGKSTNRLPITGHRRDRLSRQRLWQPAQRGIPKAFARSDGPIPHWLNVVFCPFTVGTPCSGDLSSDRACRGTSLYYQARGGSAGTPPPSFSITVVSGRCYQGGRLYSRTAANR